MARNHKRIEVYSRIFKTLGSGAEITIDWLTGVIRLAKKEWKVSFLNFRKGIYRLLNERNLSVNNYQETLRSAWHTIP